MNKLLTMLALAMPAIFAAAQAPAASLNTGPVVEPRQIAVARQLDDQSLRVG